MKFLIRAIVILTGLLLCSGGVSLFVRSFYPIIVGSAGYLTMIGLLFVIDGLKR